MRAERLVQAGVIVLIGLFAAVLFAVLLSHEWPRQGLADLVAEQAAELDLRQPVTAVLLVFRGYDTWLELAVLLAAALGVTALLRGAALGRRRIGIPAEPLLAAFTRLLLPLALMVAGYILWLGTQDPGGAFQGGVVAAAALSLLYLSNLRVFARLHGLRLRLAVALAFFLPLLLTLVGALRGIPWFGYPEVGVIGWVFALEVAVAVSVSIVLALLFIGAEPAPEGSS
jgi:multisubunit Na+/H+ antiporter MnhB subunit